LKYGKYIFDVVGTDGHSIYIIEAKQAKEDFLRECNKPEELKDIREICSEEILLIPGIGTQGGEVEKTLKYGFGGTNGNMIINVARSIIFASSGKDFAKKAREKAKFYKNLFNKNL